MIAVTKLHELFDLVIDKVASPYLSPAQKDAFLNIAQNSILDDMFPDPETQDTNPRNYEATPDISMSIKDLYKVVSGNMVTSGKIEYSLIDSLLPAGRTIRCPRRVKVTTDCGASYARFVRKAALPDIENSSFSQPTKGYPCWLIYDNYVEILPAGVYPFTVELIIEPLDIQFPTALNGNVTVNCDFSKSLTQEVVLRACEFAGISLRDGDFYEAIKGQIEGTAS